MFSIDRHTAVDSKYALAVSQSRWALPNPAKQEAFASTAAQARFALWVRFSRVNGFFAGYSVPHDLR